ncbi:Ribonuclease HII [Methanocorpusculaceae archaeon Cs1]|uniref:Ribonuclease HII n=2 Tax=Methanorbis rubei TaxID=3028300 RepID=A0AAE4MH00_9EURY|nr:Ribonuclease HII [Methanocorpusculaceae archaeon Cs1]
MPSWGIIPIPCDNTDQMSVCGVDEAGKGSVLGPMVTAGVLVVDPSELDGLGMKDSKQLSPGRREELYEIIVKRWKTAAVVKSPADIDSRPGTMNTFTASCHAEVIQRLTPAKAYLDACDVNAARFGTIVKSFSGLSNLEIVSEHKADDKFLIVGAASIVAKVTRDRLIEELSNEFGSVGSGYPSDPATIAFLEEYVRRTGTPPSCARRTWKTVDEVIARCSQQSLSDFF